MAESDALELTYLFPQRPTRLLAPSALAPSGVQMLACGRAQFQCTSRPGCKTHQQVNEIIFVKQIHSQVLREMLREVEQAPWSERVAELNELLAEFTPFIHLQHRLIYFLCVPVEHGFKKSDHLLLHHAAHAPSAILGVDELVEIVVKDHREVPTNSVHVITLLEVHCVLVASPECVTQCRFGAELLDPVLQRFAVVEELDRIYTDAVEEALEGGREVQMLKICEARHCVAFVTPFSLPRRSFTVVNLLAF